MTDNSQEFIPLTRPWIPESAKAYIAEILDSGWLTQGKWVERFEDMVQKICGHKHVVAVSSATAGLHITMCALHLQRETVIVPAFTYPATANAVIRAGAEPDFADIDPKTLNIDCDEVEALFKTTRAAAVIPVSLFGVPAELRRLREICDRFGTALIEDAACSLGSQIFLETDSISDLVDASIYSFHPRKFITTGEGGAIATNDSRLANKVRILRDHGVSNGEFVEAGFNYRMTDIQAAIGVSQLEHWDHIVQKRSEAVNFYHDLLEGWTVQKTEPYSSCVYQTYVVKVPFNDNTFWIEEMKKRNIQTQIGTYYAPTTKYYNFLRVCRYAYSAAKKWLALPLSHGITKNQQMRVVDALKEIKDNGRH